MPLLRLNRVSLAFGHRPLLEDVELEVFSGERVCLIGRNGEGKSSLLRLIAGETVADDGEVWLRPDMRIASLAQEVEVDVSGLVFDVVAGGLPELGSLISEYRLNWIIRAVPGHCNTCPCCRMSWSHAVAGRSSSGLRVYCRASSLMAIRILQPFPGAGAGA